MAQYFSLYYWLIWPGVLSYVHVSGTATLCSSRRLFLFRSDGVVFVFRIDSREEDLVTLLPAEESSFSSAASLGIKIITQIADDESIVAVVDDQVYDGKKLYLRTHSYDIRLYLVKITLTLWFRTEKSTARTAIQ